MLGYFQIVNNRYEYASVANRSQSPRSAQSTSMQIISQ